MNFILWSLLFLLLIFLIGINTKSNLEDESTVVLTKKVGWNDGFGSQLIVYIDLYCICKEYGFGYLHTPFESVEQGVSSLERNEDNKDYTRRCNERLEFLNDDSIVNDIINYKVVDAHKNTSLSKLRKLKKTIVRMGNPLDTKIPIDDNYYRHIRGKYPTKITKNEVFTIGVHIRKGDALIDTEMGPSYRLPDSYYIDLALEVIKICNELGIDPIVEIYTEIPNKKIGIVRHLYNGQAGITRYIDPTNVNLNAYDVIPNLRKYVNEDLLDTFDRMINADILIGSKSSFSVSASLLREGITIFHPDTYHRRTDLDIISTDENINKKVRDYIISPAPSKLYRRKDRVVSNYEVFLTPN